MDMSTSSKMMRKEPRTASRVLEVCTDIRACLGDVSLGRSIAAGTSAYESYALRSPFDVDSGTISILPPGTQDYFSLQDRIDEVFPTPFHLRRRPPTEHRRVIQLRLLVDDQ